MRSLLEKLEFLFDLPQRLKRCVELEAFSQAVQYFQTADGVLARYAHVASLAAIRESAAKIMEELRESLRRNIEGGDVTASKVGVGASGHGPR